MAHVVSRLEVLMREKGIKNFSELSVLTNIDLEKLMRFPGRDKIDFHTLKKICKFFDVSEAVMLELKREGEGYSLMYNPAEGVVYFLLFENDLTKIGYTKDLIKRKDTLEKEYKMKSSLLGFVASYDCMTVERVFHTMYSHKRVHGEFFKLHADDLLMLTKFEKGEKRLPKRSKKKVK